MLNQTFSLKNFEEIYDLDSRAGKNNDADFFPAVATISKRIQTRSRALKAFKERQRKLYHRYPNGIQNRFDRLKANILKERRKKDNQVTEELQRISKQTTSKGFTISLNQRTRAGKFIYSIPPTSPAPYYAIRQISRNIRSLYKIRPANRDEIVPHVVNLMSDGFPYFVVRTDISQFFESIPHDSLLRTIQSDRLVSTTTSKFIKQILYSYSTLSGTGKMGIPRGLGLSSDLAELFMRRIDERISQHPNVVFYARYVDDIIVFFAPTLATKEADFRALVRDSISENGLSQNPRKTEHFTVSERVRAFDYLGYRFSRANKQTTIEISDNRLAKMKSRVSASVKAFEREKVNNSKAAYRILLKRLKFLTGNTQLNNTKQNAYVGAYFSNRFINDLTRLEQLDAHLGTETSALPPSLLRKIAGLSFKSGFQERTFHRFNRRRIFGAKDDFTKIVEVWKHAE